MSKPLLSIIVPVYNVEKYIERCIKSILNQSFTNFELILVDDGSPDNCGKICDEYKKKDSRIKVIHKKNGGLSDARNVGIERAKGEYIAFVDSDDFINKYMYEILYKNAKKWDADISICNFKMVCENDRIDEDISVICEDAKVYGRNEALNKLYSNENLQFIVAWNKIYKKELFLNIRYDYGKCHEDEFIIHKLIYNANKIAYCPSEMYYYLQRNNSIMNLEFSIHRLDIIEALDKRMEFFRENNLLELEYRTQNLYLNYFLKYYYKTKHELKNKSKAREIKKVFKKNYKYLYKNPHYSINGKLLWIIFIISPGLFYLIFKVKDKNEFNKIVKT